MGKTVMITLTDEDFKGKSFKAIPGGKYKARVSKKETKLTSATLAKVVLVITKGPHKGAKVFDNIAAHVGWKIAQLLKALGIKKKKLSMQDFIKLIADKELTILVTVKKWEGKKQNKVQQYLPVKSEDGDDDDSDDDEDDDDDEDADDDEDSDEDDDDAGDDDDDDDDDEDDDDEAEDDDEEEDDEDDDEEDDDDDEDDDEDEDEDDDDDAPASRRKPKKKTVKKPVKKKTKKKTKKK